MTRKKVGGYGWSQQVNRAMRANDKARAAVRRILDERPGPQMMALMLAEIAICLSENRAALEEVSRIGKETG